MKEKIQFELNGKQVEVELDKEQTLLWVLRTHFNLTGTKYGCGQGDCGACTVLLNGEAVRSCITFMSEVEGNNVITIEGLAENGEPNVLQKAFMEHDALQCGFCTPGMIMNAYGLLLKNPDLTREEIIAEMEDNLCRCGAHNRIVDAIEAAAEKMKSVEAN